MTCLANMNLWILLEIAWKLFRLSIEAKFYQLNVTNKSKIFHYKFSNTYYILSQYTLKSMQLLCHCVYVSLLVYWIAYKLAYFTASYSQRFLQGQQFPSWFWRSFFVCFLVIVNRFWKVKKESNFFVIQIKQKN